MNYAGDKDARRKNNVARYLLTFGLLCLAIVLYVVGVTLPAAGLLVAAVICETAFWIRLFRRPR